MITIIHLLMALIFPSYTNNKWVQDHFTHICDTIFILDMMTTPVQLFLYLKIVYPS